MFRKIIVKSVGEILQMLTYNVNNNFLALTSTFVKKSFEVGNISVSPF